MYPDPLFVIYTKPNGEPVGPYMYGLCMAVGIICCFMFLMWVMKKKNFNEESIDKILLIGIFATAFGIFMATVFQSIYNYLDDPSQGFELAGMTFQGGLIGGVSSFLIVWNSYVYLIAPRAKSKLLQNNMNASLSDALPFIPVGITIAHGFGRLGCFFAGCCHGAKTTAWYGIYMYASSFNGYYKVVPTNLFECIFLFALSGVMAYLYLGRKFQCNFGLYAIVYGIWRFFMEFVRDDQRGSFVNGITPSQFWSIVMVVLGVAFFFGYKYIFSKCMKHPELQAPVYQKKEKAQA